MKIDLQSFYVWHPDVCSQVPEELSGHFLVISQQIQSSALQSTYQVVKRTDSAEERAAIAKGGGLEAARSRDPEWGPNAECAVLNCMYPACALGHGLAKQACLK